tara:strand:- start:11747 stop:12310 length:564 start_codon:yes stop_codon:yes gene_type:complete
MTGGCIDLDPKLDPTRFYVLTEPTPIKASGILKTLNVGLLIIEMPDYLKTSKIVLRREGSEITYSEFNRWAEDLEQGIARVLYSHLANKLPGVKISRFPWSAPTELDYRVKIRLTRFDGVRGGLVAIHAGWSIVGKGGETVDSGDFRFNGMWNGTKYGTLVSELGTGLAQLSDEIGVAISKVSDPSR